MAYRITYLPVKKVRGMEKRTARAPALGTIFFLLFLLLVHSAWPRGREVMQRLIFPGDAAVTAAALEELTGALKSGERLSEALEGFCSSVMENGQSGTD